MRGLQTELEREREQNSSQAEGHKHKLHADMEELKQEEAKLRTSLVQAQKVCKVVYNGTTNYTELFSGGGP